MKSGILALSFMLALGTNIFGQASFDRPEVIQTSFSRQMIGELGNYPGIGCCDSGSQHPEFGENHGMFGSNEGCHCESCHDFEACRENCCGNGSRFGLTISGIVDIPLDGVFHTGDDARVYASTLGIPSAMYAAMTPFDLLINEQGFEDIYDTFGGVQANLSFNINCNTDFFLGYRFTSGQANPVTVGQAVSNPATTPVYYDINAQFSDFTESQLQMGFLTSHCLRNRLDFLWGGRMGIGFVDAIDATFDIPGVTTLSNVPFYDDSTTLSFGFNYGLRMNFGCHMSAHILSGIEYRSSLNQDDSALSTYGLDELNNGSGFASLPVYAGFTYRR